MYIYFTLSLFIYATFGKVFVFTAVCLSVCCSVTPNAFLEIWGMGRLCTTELFIKLGSVVEHIRHTLSHLQIV